jgi:hypothetical protein
MRKKSTRTRSNGSKAPSIYDVAREARVSVFTVSAVINQKGGSVPPSAAAWKRPSASWTIVPISWRAAWPDSKPTPSAW